MTSRYTSRLRIFGILTLLIYSILVSGCIERPLKKVTIAFPIEENEGSEPTKPMLQYIASDPDSMILETTIDGVVRPILVISLDSSKSKTFSIQIEDVLLAIEVQHTSELKWSITNDGNRLEANIEENILALSDTTIETTLIAIPGQPDSIHLKDICSIDFDPDYVPILVEGQYCSMIYGKTRATNWQIKRFFEQYADLSDASFSIVLEE